MSVERPMIIAGGGTGGHIFPGLAVARELRRRRPERRVEWIGAKGGLEERLVPQAGLPLTLLPMRGMARRSIVQRLGAGALALVATLRLAARFLVARPALLIGVGGFASGPAVLAAAITGVPTLLLEQNAVAGSTNRFLSRAASAIAVSFPESAPRLKSRVVVTGNPVREEIAAIPPRPEGPVRSILAFGGSRGASSLNRAWIEALPLLATLPVSVTLQTGEADLSLVQEAVKGSALQVETLSFIDDLPSRLAACDLVVSRSGATTVAELTAAGRASILVPFPFAAHDHQRANARALAAVGAARVIDPEELTAHRLATEVRALVEDPAAVGAMSAAARQAGRREATRHVADLAEDLCGGGR